MSEFMDSSLIDIKIPPIEKELAKLSQKNGKQIKACLFTLIIYAQEARRANYLQELVNTILDKFPCRIIFIKGSQGAEKGQEYLHVHIANVRSGQESTLIVCDQITVEASTNQLHRVPYLILPHIIADLPVYLLWGQNPFEDYQIFPHLKTYASRVIFDAECSDNLATFCHEMLKSLDAFSMEVMDVNWALFSNWRDVLADLFNTPEKLTYLRLCKSLHITYNNTKTEVLRHPEIQAIYLQGWIASQMKWAFRQFEKLHQNLIFSYSVPTHPVIVVLSPQQQTDIPPGAIYSIELHAENGQGYYIARKTQLSQVMVHASSLEKCEVPFTLPLLSPDQGLNFLKEIFFYPPSEHYHQMLKMISQIKDSSYQSL